jgi:hypothetical protein
LGINERIRLPTVNARFQSKRTNHTEPPTKKTKIATVNIAAPALSPAVIFLVAIVGSNFAPVLPVPALGLLVLLPPVELVNGGVYAASVLTSSIND